MRYGKYLAFIALFITVHCFLDTIWLILFWSLMGVLLAIRAENDRISFPFLLLAEIVSTLFFMCFIGIRSGRSIEWADNFRLSWFALAGISIGVNVITFFLCLYTCFNLTRILFYHRK
jgi:hypothetical protein